ncbi:MAG: permease, partial [Acidobacteria bacterium]
KQALEKVRALPGVESTSGINPLPLSGVELIDSYALNETTEVSLSASFHTVLPDYFRSMKIRMLAGRDFTPIDNEQKLPLAIIDETLVKQEWPNENPLGRKILLWPRTERQRWTEIVGVVEHVKAGGFQEDGRPQIYLPYLSYPLFDLTLIARTKTEPLMLASVMKKEVENLGTQRPVHTIRALNEYVSDQLAKTRFALVLISILASIALILCLVGLYSVIAYSVKQRTHEIGIRLALGAQACDVLGLVLRQGLVLITVGVGAGLTGALALTRLMLSLLYEVKPTDTATFVGVALLLTAVAVIACWLPARRASRVDPMVALRYE